MQRYFNSLNNLIVSVYKVLGFAILCAILVGLAGYLGAHLFFLWDRAWLVPQIVAPTDERVMHASAELAQLTVTREKLAADRLELVGRMDEANRTLQFQGGYRGLYSDALDADLAARQEELERFLALKRKLSTEKGKIQKANRLYAATYGKHVEQLKKAHLIDEENYTTAAYQLSQISSANLTLEEKHTEVEDRVRSLQREISALTAAREHTVLGRHRPEGSAPPALSADVLRIREDYTRSMLEVSKARETVGTLQHSVDSIDGALKQFDQSLARLRESPWLRVGAQHLTVALVPYDNLAHARAGAPLYGCRVGILWCSRVGQVKEVLDGEVVLKHPLNGREERGRMVEVELGSESWAEHTMLHAGSAPLFF